MGIRNPRLAWGGSGVSAPGLDPYPRGIEPRDGPFLMGEPVHRHETESAASQREQQQRNG